MPKTIRFTPELLKKVLEEHQEDSDALVQKILDLYNENGGWEIEALLPIVDFLGKFSDGIETIIGVYQIFIIGEAIGEKIEKLKKFRAEQQRLQAESEKKGNGNPPAGGTFN